MEIVLGNDSSIWFVYCVYMMCHVMPDDVIMYSYNIKSVYKKARGQFPKPYI